MEKIELERQTSHKYRQGWDHLNESEHVGTARVLTTKFKRKDEESQRIFILLLVMSTDSAEHIEEAICDTMRSGCRCEHDCCGHYQTHVDKVRQIKNSNLFAVIQSSYRNI